MVKQLCQEWERLFTKVLTMSLKYFKVPKRVVPLLQPERPSNKGKDVIFLCSISLPYLSSFIHNLSAAAHQHSLRKVHSTTTMALNKVTPATIAYWGNLITTSVEGVNQKLILSFPLLKLVEEVSGRAVCENRWCQSFDYRIARNIQGSQPYRRVDYELHLWQHSPSGRNLSKQPLSWFRWNCLTCLFLAWVTITATLLLWLSS